MKKKIIDPKGHEESLQAIIDYLVDNGLSDFQVNMLIHTNMPSLGETRNIMDCVREGNWGEAWAAAELYMSGDLF